jgi:hypothetical protein
MDAAYFLKRRIEFVRFFFTEGQAAFDRVRLNIEEGKPPYDNPVYDDNPEPPFLEEWMTAETALQIVGQTSVSLLSDALKLYFRTMQSRVIGFSISREAEATAKKTGWVALYRDAFGLIFDTDWKDCPADFQIIEQVVLARNNSQHGNELTSHRIVLDPKTLARHPQPWFASEEEVTAWQEYGGGTSSFLAPALYVSQERLFTAADHIEKLADWIEARMHRVTKWRNAGNGRSADE